MKERQICLLEEITWLHISNPGRFYHYIYEQGLIERDFYGKRTLLQ